MTSWPRRALQQRALLHLAQQRDQERLEAVRDLAERGHAAALQDLDVEQLEPRPVAVHQVLDVVVVEAPRSPSFIRGGRRPRPSPPGSRAWRGSRCDQAVAQAHRLLPAGHEVGEDAGRRRSRGRRPAPAARSTAGSSPSGCRGCSRRACARSPPAASPRCRVSSVLTTFLQLEGQAVHERVVDLVQRAHERRSPSAPASRGSASSRRVSDVMSANEQDRVPQLAPRAAAPGRRTRGSAAAGRARGTPWPPGAGRAGSSMPRMSRRDRPVADAVVDRLELLVDEHRHEVAAADLAVEDLAHGVEGRVRQARQLHQVDEQQVQVLERLAQQRERRLRRRVAHAASRCRGRGVSSSTAGSTRRSGRSGSGRPAPRSGSRSPELDDAQERVVDEPQLLRPVAQRERAGSRDPTSGWAPMPEEALEAAEPHLELEQLGAPCPPPPPDRSSGAAGRGAGPSAISGTNRGRVVPRLLRHRARL